MLLSNCELWLWISWLPGVDFMGFGVDFVELLGGRKRVLGRGCWHCLAFSRACVAS
jgi:hypothetical protein